MSDYHNLTVKQKERFQRERAREPALRCPACETAVSTDELLTHLDERCPGVKEPHHLSRWVPWSRLLELGIPSATLTRWVQQGKVRRRGARRRRRYLLRDAVTLVAMRRLVGVGR